MKKYDIRTEYCKDNLDLILDFLWNFFNDDCINSIGYNDLNGFVDNCFEIEENQCVFDMFGCLDSELLV